MLSAKFWGGALMGAFISAGAVSLASPGDLVYDAYVGPVQITAQQAGQIAQVAINAGCWDGPLADVREFSLYRAEAGAKIFCRSSGVKTASPQEIPEGSVVRGYVE